MPKSEIKVLLISRIRDISKSYVCPTQREQTYVYVASHAGDFRGVRISSIPLHKRLLNPEQHSFPIFTFAW